MHGPIARQRASFVGIQLCALLVSGVLAATSQAATIIVNNEDGLNEGFNDTSAPDLASTQGGNTGATLGEQRLNAFRAAANVWENALSSAVPIIVNASMDSLTCEALSGTLGSAGPTTALRGFTNAPAANTFFVVALASSLAGTDQAPGSADITAQFNSEVGTPGCLENGDWYYGLDGDPPLFTVDFMDTVLHELAHGLGFTSLVDLETGEKAAGFDDIFSNFLADRGSINQAYPDMTDAERIMASQSVDDLVWTGAAVNASSGFLNAGRHAETSEVLMYAPSTLDEGSSVAHFDITLSPDELMEPAATASSDMRLTFGVMEDTGWVVDSSGSELKAVFESPLANAVVAGIALIRGWAFDTLSGEIIASVQFFIDGVLDADATCCSTRSDVRDAFPAFPATNTLNSGWGLTKNWGNEASGPHTLRVEIMSTSGKMFSATRTVTVVKPGDFGFLDQFSLSGVTASRVGQQVQLTGVQIRDKDSQATATVTLAYTWQGPSQQFELQSSTVVAQATPQRRWAFQTWWLALQELFAPIGVSAQGMGLRTAWEGPVAGPVGGVDLVRGWGYEQAPAEALMTIRFFIDNVQNSLVVCCSPRPDVAAAFPADVNALLSGWGLTLNWGNLTAGDHTAHIEYESTTGETVESDTRTITVVKPGGFGFLSTLSLTGATVSRDGEEIVVSGVTVTEAGTATTAQVTLRLRWDIGTQALRLVSAITTS